MHRILKCARRWTRLLVEPENPVGIAQQTRRCIDIAGAGMNGNYDNSIGWIYVPDTHINYPIMQSEDNDFYLHHGADGGYLYAGSIFLDYRCNADFSGVSNILYGHNMSNRSMFADVTNFTDRAYFDSHRYGWLTTENDVYSVCFFAVDVTENTGEIYNTDSNWRTVMSEVVNRAVIYDDIEIAGTDQIIDAVHLHWGKQFFPDSSGWKNHGG